MEDGELTKIAKMPRPTFLILLVLYSVNWKKGNGMAAYLDMCRRQEQTNERAYRPTIHIPIL